MYNEAPAPTRLWLPRLALASRYVPRRGRVPRHRSSVLIAVRRRRRVVVGAMLETALVGRLGGGNLASRGFWTCPVRLAHPRNDPRNV